MNTTDKILTLASFVYKDKIETFQNFLYKKFKIKKENIFHYNTDEDNKKVLTFMIRLKQTEKIDTKIFYPPTIIVHKKGECFYTINALNKLIELTTDTDLGNLNHKDIIIDWDKYQNKMLITNSDELKIINIEKYFYLK